MIAWLYLAGAIVTEVAATTALRMSLDRSRLWLLGVAVGYLVSFGLLALTLAEGMGLGVAYGIWSALGVVATAVIGRVVFGDPLTPLMSGGIALVMGGVLLIELGAAH